MPLLPFMRVAGVLTLLTAMFAADAPRMGTPPMPTGRRLRDIVAEKYPQGNVWVGGTIAAEEIRNKTIDSIILNREFSYTTPKNDFKQTTIHYKLGGEWKWTNSDLYIQNCRDNRQFIRAHGPISPQTSSWVREDSRTPDELRSLLSEWLTGLYGKYGNEPIVRWYDVVNETVEADGTWFSPKPGTKEWENPWTIIGHDNDKNQTPIYITSAFELANKLLPPRVKLIYNQHTKLEHPGMEKVKETILYLRSKGLRVDGMGWQSHVDMGWEKIPGNLAYLSELITWAHAHQLEFHITENNLKLPKKPLDSDTEDAGCAQTYAALMRTLLEHRDTGVVGWNCWQVLDNAEEDHNRIALLFTKEGKPKLAYYALQKLLENPPPTVKSP